MLVLLFHINKFNNFDTNMKKYIILPVLAAMLATSCSQTDDPGQAPEKPLTLTVSLDASKPQFQSGSRADDELWHTGDSLTLSFDTGAWGVVVYDAVAKLWSGTINGTPTPDVRSTVTVGYFGKPEMLDGIAQIGSFAASYIDADGSYLYHSADAHLYLKASLQPATGRIRFKGDPNREINVAGLTCNSSFNVLQGRFVYSTDELPLTVAADGYTPYVYCTFTDLENLSLTVRDNSGRYSINFAENALTSGRSGTLTLPTPDNYLGWDFSEN